MDLHFERIDSRIDWMVGPRLLFFQEISKLKCVALDAQTICKLLSNKLELKMCSGRRRAYEHDRHLSKSHFRLHKSISVIPFCNLVLLSGERRERERASPESRQTLRHFGEFSFPIRYVMASFRTKSWRKFCFVSFSDREERNSNAESEQILEFLLEISFCPNRARIANKVCIHNLMGRRPSMANVNGEAPDSLVRHSCVSGYFNQYDSFAAVLLCWPEPNYLSLCIFIHWFRNGYGLRTAHAAHKWKAKCVTRHRFPFETATQRRSNRTRCRTKSRINANKIE